jgi:hypothetical protein
MLGRNLLLAIRTMVPAMRKPSIPEDLSAAHDAALKKASTWAAKAIAAQRAHRLADARRCEDKAHDWQSKAREIARKRAEVTG